MKLSVIDAANKAASDPANNKPLEDSLEYCKERLRDSYMTFKDLRERCVIDMDQWKEREDHTFYFQPDTFLLDRPEQQALFRDQLLNRIGSMPKPDPINNIADELHRQWHQLLADQSTPKFTKRCLAEYFKRRQYELQHLKYKLLCRWAHFTLTAETMEKNTIFATQMLGKLEFNQEQAMRRHDRLTQDDGYDEAKPENRPHTKADDGGGNLYVENDLIKPQSLIREDDVEVYIRNVAYKNKLLKVVNKFMSRLKWLPLQNRSEIYEQALLHNARLRDESINRQKEEVVKVQERMRAVHTKKQVSVNSNPKMTPELEAELAEIVEGMYVNQYPKFAKNRAEQMEQSWRADHVIVPEFITNVYSLKIKITEAAHSVLEFVGNIELDNGYSYAYSISTLFPSYFQKQVIKSQFSLYDALGKSESAQKNILSSVMQVDSNIFRDIYTVKHDVPSDDALRADVRKDDIKVLRLKSCAEWIDYVCLLPTQPDWDRTQQALLYHNNPVDSLISNGMNMLDCMDLATINKINEELAALHAQNVKLLLAANRMIVHRVDQEGQKLVNLQPLLNSNNEANNLAMHMLKVLQGQGYAITGQKPEPTQGGELSKSRTLPQHLLTCFHTLRFIRSRDNKTKILYALNYFRAIQKRISIDLREFGTRERLDSHQREPMQFPREGAKNVATSGIATVQGELPHEPIDLSKTPKLLIFDQHALQSTKDLPSLKHYKANGYLNTHVMQTCPVMPRLHYALGEATVKQSEDMEIARDKNTGFSEKAIKLMGRVDKIELDEKEGEVFVKDDFGIYLMYDCSLEDMRALEDNLCSIASYYLSNSEPLVDTHDERPLPLKDRLEILDDLLQVESKFQFRKVKLIQVYMEAYEHIADPLEQQRLMQIVTDLMARRPRLNLQANYFVESYQAEIELLDKEFNLVKMLIDTQISLEKTENKNLQDALCWSYTLAQKFEERQWQYQDAEQLLKKYIKKAKKEAESDNFVKQHEEEGPKDKGLKMTEIKEVAERDSQAKIRESQTATDQESEVDDEFHENEYFRPEHNAFQALLGMPEITLESLYQNYKEKDKDVVRYMEEHSNFVQVHEGYPEFLLQLQGGNHGKTRSFRVNHWSQECGNLDFYCSLDFVNRLYSLQKHAQQELYDVLKPYNFQMMTLIDSAMIEKCISEYRKVCDFFECRQIEYAGREYVEDETILGSSEKMIFLAKEMLAHLTLTPKSALDPYQICKLDLQTIMYFDFSKVKKEDGKYLMQKKQGTTASKWLIESTRRSMLEIARRKKATKSLHNKISQDLAQGIVGTLNQQTRRVEVPSQLQIYCNLIEFMRLRNELILARSETAVLQGVYEDQMRTCSVKGIRAQFEEGIAFGLVADELAEYVDYLEEGPASGLNIDLAICEYDPKLVSNFNFRHPDAFKMCITTAGLEEVRAALTYQTMQKQLLIVATRLNQSLIDHHCRALVELKLAESHFLSVPNPVVNPLEYVGLELIKGEEIGPIRTRFKLDLSNIGQMGFYNVLGRKPQQRSNWQKQFREYLVKCASDQTLNSQAIGRIMRCFRVMVMTKYCYEVLMKVGMDAQKIQAVQACQGLRVMSRYLEFDLAKVQPEPDVNGKEEPAQLLKFETENFMCENIPAAYMPAEFKGVTYTSAMEARKVIDDLTVLDLFGVPSSLSLVRSDATNPYDFATLKVKQKEVWRKKQRLDVEDLTTLDHKDLYCEDNLKQMLVTFTPRELDTIREETEEQSEDLSQKQGLPMLDYEESMQFGQTRFASFVRYYQHLERIFHLEWYIVKLQFRHAEQVAIDNAMQSGGLFWKDTDYSARWNRELDPQTTSVNPVAQSLLHRRIISKHHKFTIAEELSNLSHVIRNLITRYRDKYFNRREPNYEYLQSYTEYRYMQVLGSMTKLVEQFYIQKNAPASKAIRGAISRITKMDHVMVAYTRANNYHVNTGMVQPSCQSLESSQFLPGLFTHDAAVNFQRCIRPVINEKALEPPQLSLFQSMYQQDNFRHKTPAQFAGSFVSTHNSVPFAALQTALIDLSQSERQYCQTYIVQTRFQIDDYMETVANDYAIKNMQAEDVYDLGQLKRAKQFIHENTQPLLLKNAIICWVENTVLPDDPDLYERYDQRFREQFFWKIIQQKERMLAIQGSKESIPSKEKLAKLKAEITKLLDNYTLATKSEEEQRDQMVKLLNEEYNAMRQKVAYDSVYTNKAESVVMKNEIEKLIIKASTAALETECEALTRCFTLAVPSISMHIHPFQQFAATCYDEVDALPHLDLVNKLEFVQEFLTKMRNRGTKVQTLTSGPGMVFTIKDVNECLQEFCRKLVKYGESQFKSRSDLLASQVQHFVDQMYVKDQQIRNLEQRAVQQQRNIHNLINGKLFEKGNQMIYQLDAQSRLLTLFKQTIFSLEREIRQEILGEMSHKITLQRKFVDSAKEKFDAYMTQTTSMLAARFQQHEDRFKKFIEGETRQITMLGGDMVGVSRSGTEDFKAKKSQVFYPDQAHPGAKLHMVEGKLSGALVPEGFIHKTYCQCWNPNQQYPLPTMQMAQLEMLSEQEARMELAENIAATQKMRTFYRTKMVFTAQKYQDQINLLKKQLNNNSYLWDQLAESEKREKVLKQELLFTQQSLSSADKVIEKLQEELKQVDAERERLAKYKSSKSQRLKDLEEKAKKETVYENVDADKLVNVLTKKDAELTKMKEIERNAQNRVDNAEHKRVQAIKQIGRKLLQEQRKTQEVVEKMEHMRLELKMMESSDSSVASIWKRKCLDLFEVCSTLKSENDELRGRCEELIVQGIKLSEIVSKEGQSDSPQRNNLSLPKLAQNPLNSTTYGKPGPFSLTTGGRGITTANTYASNQFKGLGITTPVVESMQEEPESADQESLVKIARPLQVQPQTAFMSKREKTGHYLPSPGNTRKTNLNSSAYQDKQMGILQVLTSDPATTYTKPAEMNKSQNARRAEFESAKAAHRALVAADKPRKPSQTTTVGTLPLTMDGVVGSKIKPEESKMKQPSKPIKLEATPVAIIDVISQQSSQAAKTFASGTTLDLKPSGRQML